MYRININGSTSYDVIIKNNVLESVGSLLRNEIGGSKVLIVTDSIVSNLYLASVLASLRQSNYDVSTIALPANEQSKNVDNYAFLLNVLSEHNFSSSDIVIALGGGMIGDIAGFTAATYKRGIKFVQLPTTLLSAVDASIGGKSALNLEGAKNQVGLIRNPSIVICDPSVLSSLSHELLCEGYAEIIKYGILRGPAIIDALRSAVTTNDYADVICQAVSIKKDIVEMDEFDNDFRQYLNLGHLIGHAIEAASDYHVSHGEAVAQGLFYESKCAALAGFCQMNSHLAISAILKEFNFDVVCKYTFDDLLPFLLYDKRIHTNQIQLIIPSDFGDCRMQSLSDEALADYIKLAF